MLQGHKSNGSNAILKINDLTIDYRNPLRHGRAVNGLSFDIHPGEAVALVGESGCGKSTTALSILKLLPRETLITGRIDFEGHDLVSLDENRLRDIRGKGIGMVFQEPLTSLNPVHRIGAQITEVIHRHTNVSSREARRRALELLDQVALPDAARRIDAFPHELSGGQRQRVMIAMAIALKPRLLIADEPTTALDVSVQDQILHLLDDLRREMNMALMLISHDLSVVARWTDRVVVMHHGEEMETLQSAGIFDHSRHPYTRGLIGASLRVGDTRHYTDTPLAEIRTKSLTSTGGQIELEFSLSQPERTSVSSPVAVSSSVALSVEDLHIEYPTGLFSRKAPVRAVDGVSFSIQKGATLGLVGESGCGKSSLSRAIIGLVKPTAGRIHLGDTRIDGLSVSQLRPHRRRLQMVFQDPYASLNPRHDIGTALHSLLSAHGVKSAGEREVRVSEILDQVALPQSVKGRYPHEFSGGQRQRIAIARALILRPEVVIWDEPTSALDVSVQAQILNLLVQLKHELGLTYLFISHDLAVVQYFSDEVMVMRKGRILEHAGARDIWQNPKNEYTRHLLQATGWRPVSSESRTDSRA